MTFSTIITIIGGIVTAGCAIAGAIAGIRARKAEEKRQEELKRAEHEAQLQCIKDANNAKYLQNTRVQSYPTYPTYSTYPTYPSYPTYPTYPSYPTYPTYPTYAYHEYQQPINNEAYYYHNTPQHIQQYPTYVQNQYMNQYSGYGRCNYAYGNQTRDDVYPGERAIGNMSKMEMLQRSMPQRNMFQSFGYYNRPQYAYAV